MYRDVHGAKVTQSMTKFTLVRPCMLLSIDGNVVYAHDAERKWIQNHPTVVYEAYLLKRILENLNTNLNKGKQKLFSEQSLSKTGHKLKGGYRISLMCDDDIIYLAKNVFPGAISEEFFERKKNWRKVSGRRILTVARLKRLKEN